MGWGRQQESNLQSPVYETDAMPLGYGGVVARL